MTPFTRFTKVALLFLILCAAACHKGGIGQMDYYSDAAWNAEPIVGKTDEIIENAFVKTADSSVTTFSVDADGGSYALTRKLLNHNMDISVYKDAIRIEEYINYFTYNYADPLDEETIAVNGEVSSCPWQPEHRLVRIGIKGKSIEKANYPFANFVLLIDVSGSMASEDKLELLKKGFIEFTRRMRNEDRMAIVTYAGQEKLLLESTPGSQRDKIIDAIKKLGSGGSTNGAGGIQLAYKIAAENFIAGGNNRVIIGTDGDFNVGITNTDELIKIIEEKKKAGIFLTTLGVGLGNYNEGMMERIANKGDGNYEYLDDEAELQRVFIDEYNRFVTVAKDVKVQVTFNKDIVEEYRLIGYENRALKNEDFTDDKKDAGDIAAGQTVTAIYEIKPKRLDVLDKTNPAFGIQFRYKKTDENNSTALEMDIFDTGNHFNQASEDMRFAASLAALGMYLRNSAYKGQATLPQIKEWANNARSFDPGNLRARHMDLLNNVK